MNNLYQITPTPTRVSQFSQNWNECFSLVIEVSVRWLSITSLTFFDLRRLVIVHASQKLDHIVGSVWGNVHEFCESMITYSNEHELDLTKLGKQFN